MVSFETGASGAPIAPGAAASRPGAVLLEDGSVFAGEVVSPGTRFGEVVFNTSMTGYQEILTDPSYRGQIVVMTQPHMGNYGIADAADESRRPWVEGFLARRFTTHGVSRATGDDALVAYLRRHRIPAIQGLDTRALVRRLRRHGALRGAVTSEVDRLEELQGRLEEVPSMVGRALVEEVSCGRSFEVPAWSGGGAPESGAGTLEPRCRLVVYDFGVKANILRSLAARGAELVVVPATTPAAEALGHGVDGVVLSNGPGDPQALGGIVREVAALVDSGVPILGICLGHQLLGLALGGKTFKLKFGHHGGNQPVRHLDSGEVTITSQNHGFALDPESLPESCRATELNLNDGTLEAFVVADRPVFSVQYHPEAAPGPHDASPIFDRFLEHVGAGA